MNTKPNEEVERLYGYWKSGNIHEDHLHRLAFLLGFPSAVVKGTKVQLNKRDLDGLQVDLSQEYATATFEIAYIINRLPDHIRGGVLSAVDSLISAERSSRGVLQAYLNGVKFP
jgi:hypothetical protein